MKMIIIILFALLTLNDFEQPEKPDKYYIELLLKRGDIYHRNKIIDKDNRIETIRSIYYNYCDSLMRGNCRYIQYRIVVDSSEKFGNVVKFANELRKLKPRAFFKTNKTNDTINTQVHLPYPKELIESGPEVNDSLVNILEIFGDESLKYDGIKIIDKERIGLIDSLLAQASFVCIQPVSESRFSITLEMYRLFLERFKLIRNKISNEQFGLEYDELLKNHKEMEYEFIMFNKQNRFRVIVDFNKRFK